MTAPDAAVQLADFRVFPRHVGVWEGNWVVLDADCQEQQRFTAKLTQRIVDNQWVQTNQYTYADGRTDTQQFTGTVEAFGQIRIEGAVPPFSHYTTIAAEHDERYIVFQVWDKASGSLRATELITLTNNTERIRTTQSFTPDGKLRGVMVITERKIAD